MSKPPNPGGSAGGPPKTRWGGARDRFFACGEDIKALIAEGLPLSIIHERLAERLGGFPYESFVRLVVDYIGAEHEREKLKKWTKRGPPRKSRAKPGRQRPSSSPARIGGAATGGGPGAGEPPLPQSPSPSPTPPTDGGAGSGGDDAAARFAAEREAALRDAAAAFNGKQPTAEEQRRVIEEEQRRAIRQAELAKRALDG